jgi:dipeptidyl aminopeptidase/acylaminoacyl peptidase
MIRRILVFVIGITALGWGQGKRPFTFEDMMSLKRIGEPVPSPDGRWMAFSAVEVNLQENKKTPHLWVLPLAGPTRGAAKQISSDAAGEDRPRWSPDGKKIAFLSAKDGGSQVWVADFDAANVTLATAQKLTAISTEAGGELWSPDGKWILFTSEVYPDCPNDACNKQRDEEKAKSPVKATVFNGLFYRHWSNFRGAKRTHLFLQPVAGGRVVDLTPGNHDAPPFSLGGQDMYAFSPDTQEVAFTSNIDEVEATSTNNEIFTVPVAGGTPKKISTSPGSDSTPQYSPDGKYIAWRMQETPGYESDRFQLVMYDRSSGVTASMTKGFDRWVGSFVWDLNSRAIYFTAENEGESPIYMQSIFAGRKEELVLRGHFDDLAIARHPTIINEKHLLATGMSVSAPSEIYSYELTRPAKAVPLTHLNDAVLAQLAMQPLEPFWFTGAANQKVQGFLVRPPNFDGSKKYPVKFLIHGGPEGAWGDSWSYRWNAELMAAGGYVVLMINFTGSTGYGQKFTQGIQGDWGGRPFEDLMKGLDYVETKFPFVDKDRECALGASFGGYMANWILGHTTRFKCIVSHDGMFNTQSAYGTTEELWFPEWEFKGTPWANRAMYDKWSPHLFAAQFKTPTLVVHGQRDYRLDVSQGFDLFTTLQRLKIPSKMLYFPDEGHWVLKPQNSQLWWNTVGDWVDQWIGDKK